MSDKYILGPDHELIPCEDLFEWARWFEDADRIVEQTGNRSVHVSTVFLGLDHAWFGGDPVVFETLVFGGRLDGEMDRYCTWAEAERGHRRWVKRVFKHRPRRNGRAIRGDFTAPRKSAREAEKMENTMKGLARATEVLGRRDV